MLFFSTILLLIPAAAMSMHIPAEGKQLDGFVQIGEVGNKIIYAGSEELSWFDAKLACQSQGLELVAAESKDEETFLLTALTILNGSSHYWTSGRDREAKEQLIWDTTGGELSQIGEVSYTINSCLSIRVPDFEQLWRVLPCSDAWPAVCQKSS